MDELDRSLLRLLGENARRSFRELARLTGSTTPTVAARVRRLEDAGIIQGYTIVTGGGPPVAPKDVAYACHWCHQSTADPRWSTLDGKRHPFCCPTCQAQYKKRYRELS